MNCRFLKLNENTKTRNLADRCFQPISDNDDYYLDDIFDSRIAVAENEDGLISMAHLRRFILTYNETEKSAWYICYVCTDPEYRNKGYMSLLLKYVLDTLKKEGEGFTFLAPVDKDIYEKLGFRYSWKFNAEEADILYADDDISECCACLLNDTTFVAPDRIRNAESYRNLFYRPFSGNEAVRYFDYFHIRPNKSYDSTPLDTFIWTDIVNTQYCIVDNRCLLLRDNSEGTIGAALPFCRENELCYYQFLQERYFEYVLRTGLKVYLADEEGTKYLENAGMLSGYDITEEREIFDYIYSGEALRTLKGRKFSKKRNHLTAFLKKYEGRWEYRTLGYDDRMEIIDFLHKWNDVKVPESGNGNDGINLGGEYDIKATLEIDEKGTIAILSDPELLKCIKTGGIYISGELKAFSIGAYNPDEKMAVVEIEKADPDIEGLYQLINREFLVHEFSDAELVNREDDVGIPGLRQAKMSYHPVMFEKRYNIEK
ncbi:MAG: GNAT family N-acetyltransferase [Lachnospiraceae bacterium]|nr:GNAT family N-acetyltransferase [Lachnospiraceae bacterium]